MSDRPQGGGGKRRNTNAQQRREEAEADDDEVVEAGTFQRASQEKLRTELGVYFVGLLEMSQFGNAFWNSSI